MRPNVRIPYHLVKWYAGAFDLLVITAASLIAGVAYHAIALDSVPDWNRYLAVGALCAILHFNIEMLSGSYQLPILLEPNRQVARLLGSIFLSTLLVTLLLFLFKIGEDYSRGGLITFAALSIAMLVPARTFFGKNLRHAVDQGALMGKRTIVVGDSLEMRTTTSRDLLRYHGMTEVARFELRSNGKSGDSIFDELIELSRSRNAESIALALSWINRERIDLFRHHLGRSPLAVHLLPDTNVNGLIKLSTRNRRSFAIELQREPLTTSELFVKRLIDIFVSIIALSLLSPLLCIVAVLVKLDTAGPIIFRQRRQGFNGKIFLIFKFRSMTVMDDGTIIRQAERKDSRVTRIGSVLRRTSIDELPQLINVLKGDMSLVGPRPHALAHDNEYGKAIATYAFRQHVKPGITGWAQVNGLRGETGSVARMEMRVEHDLWYINNWSIWLDLRILLRSGFMLFGHSSAY